MLSILQWREQLTNQGGVRQVLVQTLLIRRKRDFIFKESQNFICGLKTEKKYLIFSLFFSQNLTWNESQSIFFFVCFQQQLLKLKFSIELRKSNILSTLIFHIASFFKEKNNACRRESCFFYRNHLLEQKNAFLRQRNMKFFSNRNFELLFDLNNVVSVGTKASLRTFWRLPQFFWKNSNLNFCQKWSDARADYIFCFSQNMKNFFKKKHWTT